MIGEDVLRYVQKRQPDFTPTGAPVRLPEGNLNFVWRVPGTPAPLIVKFAPPYVAANPGMPLDPSRLVFEARALEALAPGGRLASISSDAVRPPRPIDMGTEPHVLLMEDVGAHPTLGPWLRAEGSLQAGERIGRRLGQFIGRLHGATFDDAAIADDFDNQPVQETRFAVQYEAAEEMLSTAGVDDAAALGQRAVALGERLLSPGRCLTMGDLWPPSVIVAEEDLRVIDWELVHFGRPVQDVAHFAAHAWMQAHRAPETPVAQAARRMLATFLEAYRSTVEDSADQLPTDQMRRDCAVHFGAEILVRTVGRFQEGYLYEGLAPEAPAVQEAITVAAAHIRMPEQVDTFTALG